MRLFPAENSSTNSVNIKALQTNPEKKRDGTADLLKGLAVFFMVQVHIMEQFGTAQLSQTLVGKISYFLGGPACAPVFLAVMGYYLLPGQKPVWFYLKRGLVLFTGGILLNAGRSLHLFLHIGDNSIQLDPWPFVFGADILPMAGLSLMVIAPLSLVFRKQWWAYLILAVAVSVASMFTPEIQNDNTLLSYVQTFFTGHTAWSYFPLVPWLAYILTGISFRCLMVRYPSLTSLGTDMRMLWFIIPGTFVLLITLSWAASVTNDLQGDFGYYYHTPVFFSWTVLFIILYMLLARNLELMTRTHPLFNLVRWTGQNVTLVYVVQWLIIGNLATAFYQSQGVIGFFGWSAAILGISLAISWVSLRSGMLRFLKRVLPG
jgi:hypothetical protein